MPSFNTPTSQEIEVAIQRTLSVEHAAYFYAHLDNPEWIAPLRAKDVFKNSPRSMSWPPSAYLARMARHKPELVAEIFRSMKTENPVVLWDMIDAAKVMPPGVARVMVPSICLGTKSGGAWARISDVIKLCQVFALGGDGDSALCLADAIFVPPGHNKRDLGAYWWTSGLNDISAALISVRPKKFLQRLCLWLTEFIRESHTFKSETNDDLSNMWRPAVEEHAQNNLHDLRNAMAGIVRGGFEQAIRDAHVTVEGALELLASQGFLFFKRLRIHLVCTFADRVPELARITMMDRALSEDSKFLHEYVRLIHERLPMLEPAQRDIWYSWIESGPDVKPMQWFISEVEKREPTPLDCQRYKEAWQLNRLHWARNHHEGIWRQRYEQLLSTYGEPTMADLNCRASGGLVVFESPFSLADLNSLTFAGVLAKIASWCPQQPRQVGGVGVEGLAEVFGQYVKEDILRISEDASLVQGMPEAYVRVFLQYMTLAIKEGHDINIQHVLELGKWVLSRPPDENVFPMLRVLQGPKGWQWSRDCVAELISAICIAEKEGKARFSLETCRTALRNCIEILVREPTGSNVEDPSSPEGFQYVDFRDWLASCPVCI